MRSQHLINIKNLLIGLIALFILSFASSTSWAAIIGDEEGVNDELDLHAPEPGYFYTRETPIVLTDQLLLINGKVHLPQEAKLAWLSLFTSAEIGMPTNPDGTPNLTADRTQAKTVSRLLLNDNVQFASPVSEEKIIIPVREKGWAAHFEALPKPTVSESQEAIYAYMKMPSKQAFSQQESGIPETLALQYGLTNITAPNALGERYFKVEGNYEHEQLYHQLEYDNDGKNNWQEAKKSPFWD